MRLIHGESGDDRLSETELLHDCIFILNAGYETTTNLVGNALHARIKWPSERQRLINNPIRIAMRSKSSSVWRARTSSATGSVR